MALHVTNPKADKLARKLARQRGETVTDAIIHALEERLARSPRPHPQNEDAKVAELLAIAERAIGLQAEGKSSRELIDELYDEYGLPV